MRTSSDGSSGVVPTFQTSKGTRTIRLGCVAPMNALYTA